jgi:hypothetical protein
MHEFISSAVVHGYNGCFEMFVKCCSTGNNSLNFEIFCNENKILFVY